MGDESKGSCDRQPLFLHPRPSQPIPCCQGHHITEWLSYRGKTPAYGLGPRLKAWHGVYHNNNNPIKDTATDRDHERNLA